MSGFEDRSYGRAHGSREGESRRAEEREDLIFNAATSMAVPDFGPGIHSRWVRYLRPGNNDLDHQNIASYRRMRWRFVRPEELPDDFYCDQQKFRGEDIVVNGDTALMVHLSAHAEEYRRQVHEESNRRVYASHPISEVGQDPGKVDGMPFDDRSGPTQFGIRRK